MRVACASKSERRPNAEEQNPRRPYRPEWEAQLLDPSRVYAYLAQGRWFRLASNVGAVSLGGHVYVLGRRGAKQQVEVPFDAPDQHLVFHSTDGQPSNRLPVKGSTPDVLMGELGPLNHLPAFQLALPFTWDEGRVVRLCGTLGVRLNDH